jgi:hypothetical protein
MEGPNRPRRKEYPLGTATLYIDWFSTNGIRSAGRNTPPARPPGFVPIGTSIGFPFPPLDDGGRGEFPSSLKVQV